MANYQETIAEGVAWRRCYRVIIDNPVVGTKTIRFFEERAVTIADEVIRADAGLCSTDFDPAALVTVVDPATLEPTGDVVTQGYLYQLLLSAYMNAANARDTPSTPAVFEPVPE